MIPEFVGRLPVTVTLNHLREQDLVRILTEPKNALVRQYQGLFSMEGADLEFTQDGLEAISDIALRRETGVRALRSILESILLDVLYELPNRQDKRKFVVDREVVEGRRSLAIGLRTEDVAETAKATEDAADDGPEGEEPSEKRESA